MEMAVLLSGLGSPSLIPAISAPFSRVDTRQTSSSSFSSSSSSPPSLQLGRVLPPPPLPVVEPKRRQAVEEGACTADELHYAPVSNSDWRIALWRYLPSSKAPRRNHPLLLLSGVGTNSLGYDLSPESSFARFMSGQGFDTWIVELRGIGLSLLGDNITEKQLGGRSSRYKQRQIASDLLENLRIISKNLDPLLDEGSKMLGMQDSLTKQAEDLQRRLELIRWYNWDFDNYVEEDVPSAMEYVRNKSKPRDGKLHAIGHSMGGMMLYAMLSKCCHEGRDTGFASVTTLASALDYSSSNSFLKNLLFAAVPAQAFRVPVMPMGIMFTMVHHLMFRPPYALSWLSTQVSAPQMMKTKLLEKLILNNFCTVPSKLLLQLSTAFQDSPGLRDRTGTFYYKENISKTNVPVLALAADWDTICPPEAVYETVKLIKESLVTYKVIGEPGGPHYGHYDLVVSREAPRDVYPSIIQFLERHDDT